MFRIKPCLLLLSLSLLFTNGCALISHGRSEKINLQDLDAIEIGITTKDNIKEMFEEPQKIIYRHNNIESFIYIHGVERSVYIPFALSLGRSGGTGENLIINFENNIVTSYEFVVDQRYLMN